MSGPHTPLADSYLRARYGLPHDFDLESVPFSHLEYIGAEFRREAEAKQKKEAARQKALDALRPPKIIAQFLKTASHLQAARRIAGIASTGAINSHNYVLCPGGADIILPLPLLLNHDPQKCIGSVEAARIDDAGRISIWANLDSRCDAHTWRRIQSGDLRCFSGAADMKTAASPVNLHGIDHYFSWRLKEVSLCESGANHECIVTEVWPPISEAQIVDADAMGKFKSLEQREVRIAALDELDARIKSLERPGAGVQIVAEGMTVSVPGMSEVADMIKRLDGVLRQPIQPIYDGSGKLVGAQRVEALGDEPTGHSPALAAVETRIKALESRPATAYRGIWTANEAYETGEQVTCKGGLWTCREPTKSRPGEDDTWKLSVKSGRA